MKTWLILDVSCLAWRSFYSVGELSHEGIRTGVVYSILRDVTNLQGRFGTRHVAFCFDVGPPLRCTSFAGYKQARAKQVNEDPAFKEAKAVMHGQLDALRTDYLSSIGYRNIFWQYGYEADDLIAKAAMTVNAKGERAIIVGSDHDLYQLLDHRVRIWNPVKSELVTRNSFSGKYGITPESWPLVKAMAGCQTDSVPGIRGVGEKTACRFLNGSLNPKSKAFDLIVKGTHITERNLELVRLPFKGVRKLRFKEDEVTRAAFESVAQRLGINSKRLLLDV